MTYRLELPNGADLTQLTLSESNTYEPITNWPLSKGI